MRSGGPQLITLTDDSGGALVGAIDGVNQTYTTSQAVRLDRVVEVYVNGSCRMASLDNGYSFADAQTLVMNEPLEPGDTLSVRYNCSPVLVGVPNAQIQGLTVVLADTPQTLQATIPGVGALSAGVPLRVCLGVCC